MWPEIVHSNFWYFIYEIWLRRLMLRYYSLNTEVCVCPQPGSLFYDVRTPHWNQCAAFNFVCWSSSILREKSNILRHFLKLFVCVMPCFLWRGCFIRGRTWTRVASAKMEFRKTSKSEGQREMHLRTVTSAAGMQADSLPCLTAKTLQIVFSSRL